jgi:hypothetical protein
MDMRSTNVQLPAPRSAERVDFQAHMHRTTVVNTHLEAVVGESGPWCDEKSKWYAQTRKA